MNKKTSSTLLIAMLLASNTLAVTITTDVNINDAGLVAGDLLRIRSESTTTVTNLFTTTLDNLQFGWNGDGGTLSIEDGGTLSTTNVSMGYRSDNVTLGQITVKDGGTLNVLDLINIGGDNAAGAGSFNQLLVQGNVTVENEIDLGRSAAQPSDFSIVIDGGTLTSVNNRILMGFKLGEAGTVTFTNGGQLVVSGNWTNYYQTRIDAGLVTGVDTMAFDGTNTTITAIPEPATLGLIAAAGVSMIFIRRHFSI